MMAALEDCVTLDDYGGGWKFVNSGDRSCTDMTLSNLESTAVGGYNTPSYDFQGAMFHQVLVRRLTSNWCDSWGRNTGTFVETDGASMGIQADDDYFYYYNNGQSHALIRAAASYRSSCSGCWTSSVSSHQANSDVTFESLESDGSVVKITLPSSTHSRLVIANFDAFINQAGGCNADGPVAYQVFIK